MAIIIRDNLSIEKDDMSWNVVVTKVTKKRNGGMGERRLLTYHGTLAQALKKCCDILSYEPDDGDVDCLMVASRVNQVLEEMESIAKRIETLYIIQA